MVMFCYGFTYVRLVTHHCWPCLITVLHISLTVSVAHRAGLACSLLLITSVNVWCILLVPVAVCMRCRYALLLGFITNTHVLLAQALYSRVFLACVPRVPSTRVLLACTYRVCDSRVYSLCFPHVYTCCSVRLFRGYGCFCCCCCACCH